MFSTLKGKSFLWEPIDSRARTMVEAAMEMKGAKEPLYWPLIQSFSHFSNIFFIFGRIILIDVQARPCRVTMWKLWHFFFFQLWDKSEKVDKPVRLVQKIPSSMNGWKLSFLKKISSSSNFHFFLWQIFLNADIQALSCFYA